MRFIHLHNHSDYSILDGAITIDRLIDKAAELGMPGVALTDHGNMFGAIEFYQKAKERGIKPIIGQEFYVAPRSRFDRDARLNGKDASHHLLLLARDFTGYRNLIRLSSIAYMEGFYYKPRIDMEVLDRHKEGLIASTACLGGEIPALILQGKTREARLAAGRFQELFGRDHFYLELQDHGIPEQKTVNSELIRISGDLDIPLIATNDCHYLNREDAFSHEVLLCIQTGKILEDESRMRFSSDKFYFRTPEEMQALFPDYPDALYNTYKIYEMTELELELGEAILPHFTVPGGFTLDSYLQHLVAEGARRRFGESPPPEVEKRIEYELSVITRMKFSGYFLIVWDFINFARSRDIPVGPGRGSAAGSMVSYCLGITSLDPIRYNLLFERFLNPDRNEMPDMDIDFCADRREEVIEYVKRKYGEDHVSQIITFNTMSAKAVIKDVARVLNIPFAEANLISKLIQENSLKKALDTSEEFRNIREGSEKGRKLVDIALTLEGLVRSAGKHAAGVVISRDPLMEHIPLYKDSRDGSISSQFEKLSLEKTGLVKMDLLGLKNLTIIDHCLKLIRGTRGETIDLEKIPLDDAETYRLLQKANTMGVFQLESGGMQNILRRLGPNTFEDIIAVVALYRPGPLDLVDDYVARKHNPGKVAYLHPKLEPILKETFGIMIYQEQVMLISQVIGGFTLPEADKLRKAMSKKKPELLAQMEEKFLKGAKEKKIEPRAAGEIFSMINKFAGYGFNKSHAAAYAMVSFQTAYLKAHYPIEYMTALLSAQPDKTDDVIKYVNDSKSIGIPILPPDINRSELDFKIEGKAVRFGLSAIKGVGEKAIESVLEARERLAGFKNLRDFLENIDIFAVNKGVLESLVKAGAFDAIHQNRAQLFLSADLLMETAKKFQEDRSSGQGNLFDMGGTQADKGYGIDLPAVKEWHDNEKLSREKEVMGLYISGHPLARYEKEIRAFACTSIAELGNKKENGEYSLLGIISHLKVRIDKKGNRFAVGILEDMEGSLEAIFFSGVFSRSEKLITSEEPVMVKGKVEFEEGAPKKIIVNEVKNIKEIRREAISAVHIRIDVVGLDDAILKKIRSIIVQNRGDCPIFFHVNEKAGEKIVRAHANYSINPSDRFLKDLTQLVGQDSIRYSIGHC